MTNIKIHIDGKDNMGWSIDSDRANLTKSIERLGIQHSESFFSADIIHNIWWNNLSRKIRLLSFLKKNILVTTSNFVNLDDPNYILWNDFKKIKNIAKAWISPSSKQKYILERNGVRCYYQPFYLDLDLFKPPSQSRNEICKELSIKPDIFNSRVVIGSFQRDSLGSDLSKPKWQKGPELLIDLLKELPKDKYILVLAGPRRHFVRNECKKYNIPYLFVGKETNVDDIKTNTIDIKKMPLLYYLTDIYLVTSTSEGGPKAAMEAPATKTLIMSTDVGLAREFIEEEYIFADNDRYKRVLTKVVNEYKMIKDSIRKTIEEQYERCIDILNQENMDTRLFKIYKDVLNE